MYSFCTYNLEPCLMGFGYTVQAMVKTIYFIDWDLIDKYLAGQGRLLRHF